MSKVKLILRRIVSSVLLLFAFVFPLASSSWVVSNELEQSNITAILDETPPYVCYNADTGVRYRTLKAALDNATSSQEIVTYVNSTIDCYETLEIRSGITLTIPFVGPSFDSNDSSGNILESPLFKPESADDRNLYGNTLGDANDSKVSTYRSCLVNMRNGADIVVLGTLNLGGAISYNGNNGYYSEINLGDSSSIVCRSGSLFNCYGYVKEDYETAKNSGMPEYEGQYENEFDSERYVLAESGSTVYTSIAFYDLKTAGGLTGALDANISPFNVFDFQSLQTFTRFMAGTNLFGTTIVVGPSNIALMEDFLIISSKTSETSLLYLTSGGLSLEYKPSDPRYSSRDTNSNPTNIVINGHVDVGYLYFSIGILGVNVEMDTREFFLPFSSKMSLIILSGSTFRNSRMIKFLMGSSVLVEDGATFQIDGPTAFYNSSIAPQKDDSLGISYDSSNKPDAIFKVNGTLVLNSDGSGNGAVGGNISHSSKTGTGSVDFTNASKENLTVEVNEGTAGTIVVARATGLYKETSSVINGQFSAGGLYSSSFDGESYYWSGNFHSTYSINVTYDKNVINPVFSYTILLSENADGSNTYNSELVNSNSEGTATVQNGSFFNISVDNGQSVSIAKSNGETIEYDASSWIYIDDDFDIHIVPSEGVKISLSVYKDETYSDNESQWSAGTGHTYYFIETSDSLDGEFNRVYDQKGSGISSFTVLKGSYFRIGYYWDQSDTIISLSGQNGFTGNNEITTNDESFLPQPATEWVNDSTSSTSPVFLAGNENSKPGLEYTFRMGYYSGHALADQSGSQQCLLPDSMVMMSDGTYKRAADLTQADSVMSFNHWTGCFEGQKLFVNFIYERQLFDVIELSFSNGMNMAVVSGHGLFNLERNRYEIYYGEEFKKHIGERFVAVNYDGIHPQIEETVLIDAVVRKERVVKISPVSEYNVNLIVDGLLNIPDDLEGVFDAFEYSGIDGNLRIDSEAFASNVEKYGLFTYDDVKEVMPRYIFDKFNFAYFKTFLGMGVITAEKINQLLMTYAEDVCDWHGIEWDWNNSEPFSL